MVLLKPEFPNVVVVQGVDPKQLANILSRYDPSKSVSLYFVLVWFMKGISETLPHLISKEKKRFASNEQSRRGEPEKRRL